MTRLLSSYFLPLLARAPGGDSGGRSRSLVAVVLVLLLVLGGQSMAVARGASAPSGEMVLCTGTGPVTVLVDAQGNPTSPAHYCPDCVMSLVDMLAAGQDWPLFISTVGKAQAVTLSLPKVGLDQPSAQARGPPVSL